MAPRRFATVHIVNLGGDDDDEDRFPGVRDICARYPGLDAVAEPGDLVENSRVAGYRASGWYHINRTAAGRLKIESLEYGWDDYGMPSLAFEFGTYPADYWTMDNMTSVDHTGGTASFAGYWHSDEAPMMMVLPTDLDPDSVQKITGTVECVEYVEPRSGTTCFLVNDGLTFGPLAPGGHFSVVAMPEADRQRLCPHVDAGFAVQNDQFYTDKEHRAAFRAWTPALPPK
eukprot:m.478919 g.478919  ORF g.478919 m.478919 type:complete len:229 (+) comp21273_c0_seq1:1993-2679(+)